MLDLVSSLVKKASELLHIATTLQEYTAKFILEASVSKRNPQRRQDIDHQCSARNIPCSSSAVINLVYKVLFIYYVSKGIKSFVNSFVHLKFITSCVTCNS